MLTESIKIGKTLPGETNKKKAKPENIHIVGLCNLSFNIWKCIVVQGQKGFSSTEPQNSLFLQQALESLPDFPFLVSSRHLLFLFKSLTLPRHPWFPKDNHTKYPNVSRFSDAPPTKPHVGHEARDCALFSFRILSSYRSLMINVIHV